MIVQHNNRLIDDVAEVGLFEGAVEEPTIAKIMFESLHSFHFGDPARAKFFILLKRMHAEGPLDSERVRLRIARLKPDDREACLRVFNETRDTQLIGSAIHCPAYIERLKDLSQRRLALRKLEDLRHRALDLSSDVEKELTSATAEIASRRSRAVGIGHMQQFKAESEAMKAGQRRAVPLPWAKVGSATRALTPGKVLMFAGPPGSSKALGLNQILLHFYRQEKIGCLVMEDGRKFHMRRGLLAQMCGNSQVTDAKWVEENPAENDALEAQYEPYLSAFGDCLHQIHNDELPTAEYVQDWVADRIRDKCRIVAIDPVTMIDFGKYAPEAEKKWTFVVGRMLEQSGASMILVTHPKNMSRVGPKRPPMLDDLAMSQAFQRFTQTVLYLQPHDPFNITVKKPAPEPDAQEQINRTVRIMKARLSWGGGMCVGMWFNRETLTTEEVGFY